MQIPRATYRLQFNEHFRLADALGLVPYLHDLGLFVRSIRSRYGDRASGVLHSYTQHKVRILRNTGLAELRKGNRAAARKCLIRSLAYDRTAFKTYLRIARTLLPMSIIRALDRSRDRR